MNNIHILWVDDEIELLKPHILFLESKSYSVDTASNGADALEMVNERFYDIIFLDENMPGLSGIETLLKIKQIKPAIPVVMITKSEEENIMEEAIGANIADYLIKPVNPNQVILSIKKNVQKKDIVSQKTSQAYQQRFQSILSEINMANDYESWISIYKKLVYWELELERSGSDVMDEVLNMQKDEANSGFCKFIKSNYKSWFTQPNEARPVMSPELMQRYIIPQLSEDYSTVFILVDNLRYDQWLSILPKISPYFNVEQDDLYYSILPTATQYSRNAIFAGLMPLEIDRRFPNYWLNDDEEGGKNEYEPELLNHQLQRFGKNIDFHFEKIFNNQQGGKLVNRYKELLQYQLSVLVFNFVDILSHAKTDSKMIKELAGDEASYRSLTMSWFEHSPLFDLLKRLSKHKVRVFITTDHGTLQVKEPKKVIGDRNTSSNLRYKMGRSLDYNPKEVFEVKNPKEVFLPTSNLTSSYIFAVNNDFFAYPNKYNHYVKYYKNTLQHGGISMQEMLIPAISLVPK